VVWFPSSNVSPSKRHATSRGWLRDLAGDIPSDRHSQPNANTGLIFSTGWSCGWRRHVSGCDPELLVWALDVLAWCISMFRSSIGKKILRGCDVGLGIVA
jgi:hypothetical protein